MSTSINNKKKIMMMLIRDENKFFFLPPKVCAHLRACIQLIFGSLLFLFYYLICTPTKIINNYLFFMNYLKLSKDP